MNFHLIRNAKIRTKLLVCLIILGSLTAVIGAVASRNATNIQNQFSAIVDVSTPRLIALLQVKASAAKVETSATELDGVVDSKTTTVKEELLANLESLQNAQTEYARQAKAYPEKVQEMNAAVDRVSTGSSLLVSALEQKASPAQINPLSASLHTAVRSLGGKVDHLIDTETYQLRKSNAAADKNVATQQKINLIIQAIALLLVIAIGFLLSRLIVRPLARLRRGVDLIAKGNLDEKLPLGSTDEIGELTNSIDKLRITVKYLLDDAKTMDQEVSQKKARQKS